MIFEIRAFRGSRGKCLLRSDVHGGMRGSAYVEDLGMNSRRLIEFRGRINHDEHERENET